MDDFPETAADSPRLHPATGAGGSFVVSYQVSSQVGASASSRNLVEFWEAIESSGKAAALFHPRRQSRRPTIPLPLPPRSLAWRFRAWDTTQWILKNNQNLPSKSSCRSTSCAVQPRSAALPVQHTLYILESSRVGIHLLSCPCSNIQYHL